MEPSKTRRRNADFQCDKRTKCLGRLTDSTVAQAVKDDCNNDDDTGDDFLDPVGEVHLCATVRHNRHDEGSPHDLVSIDHRCAGYLITEHFLKLGCRRIAFVAYRNAAQSTKSRVAGYQEALLRAGVPFEPSLLQALSSDDPCEIARFMERLKPDAIACANDRTAGRVMQSLIGLNYRIPKDARIIGFDDIQYANLLPVPLTTIHQPCHDMGITAAAAMLERVATPGIPTREMLLDCHLVVRDSCGAHASGDRSMLPISDGLTAVFG